MKIITDNTVTLYDNLKPVIITSDHPNFAMVYNLASQDRLEEALEWANPRLVVEKSIADTNFELMGNDSLYYGNYKIPETLAIRIFDLLDDGRSIKYLENFVVNLLENPSFRAVQELYSFLEISALPITEDGHFIAYKSVNYDYKDHFTGKMDNSIGAKPSMPRNTVDEDKDRTCSYGLHFASYDYAIEFGPHDSHLMAVKINPRDVVAIPSDYNNQKGRACTYEIVAEIESKENELAETPLYIMD